MARYNEILVGRLNRHLQKLLGMKGEPPAPQLSTEIQPGFDLYNIPAEERYLQGWNRFGNTTSIAAAAGAVSIVRFRNPVASGAVATLESIFIRTTVAATIVQLTLTPIAADLAVVTPAVQRLDARIIGGSAMITSSTTGVSTVGLYQSVNQPVAATEQQFIIDDDQEIVVMPGDAWNAITGQFNVGLTVNLIWRERVLEESERF